MQCGRDEGSQVAETRQMTTSSSLSGLTGLPLSSPTSIAPEPDGHCRRLGKIFSASSQSAKPFMIDVAKDRRPFLFRSETRHTIRATQFATTLPHPRHHEFNRARLLKTFGSRSAKNASMRIPARNRKNTVITLGFRRPRPRPRAPRSCNALTQRVNSQFPHNSSRRIAGRIGWPSK